MNADLGALVDAFAGQQILVVGEAMLDSYLEGHAERLSREAPVPIVALDGRSDAPGGAANTAANVYGLGGDVSFLSVVGLDPEGKRLRDALRERGLPTEQLLISPVRQTLAKHRVVADGQVLVRFDQGSLEPVDVDLEDQLIERLQSLWHRMDAVIVSDYGYGVLTPRIISVIAELQAHMPHVVVGDAKDLTRYRRVGLTAVKPNYGEAVRLLGELPVSEFRQRLRQIGSSGDRLIDSTGARIVAVTLDTDGAIVFERGRPPYRTYARPTADSRAAGAGDTFVAALALSLAAGGSTPAAAELAAAAAAVVVGRDGTAMCSALELREHLSIAEKRVETLDRLADRVEFYRRQGRRVVFTNGVFDILHRGHITYLNRAKSLGDVLIVGVNSDASVKRLKGPTRPINSLEDRLHVLSALSCIDHLVAFDEDTPIELIEAIRPHVYAKGGDYTRETLPETSVVERLGGAVQILPFVEDRSTTGLIERVRNVFGPAGEPARTGAGVPGAGVPGAGAPGAGASGSGASGAAAELDDVASETNDPLQLGSLAEETAGLGPVRNAEPNLGRSRRMRSAPRRGLPR